MNLTHTFEEPPMRKYLRKQIKPFLLGLMSFLYISLTACSDPVIIRMPLDISRANQIATAKFTVKRTGTYRVALLFKRESSLAGIEKQEKIWGNIDDEGIATEVGLQVQRDSKLIFDRTIRAVGTGWGQSFEYKGERLNTAVRLIKIIELQPGDYTIEARTLNDIQAFRDISSWIEFTYYNPKH